MDQDLQEAKRLLDLHRDASAADQSSMCVAFPRPQENGYTYTEVNQVLAEVVDRNGSLGLVQALISLGADVNLAKRRSGSLWHKVIRRDQEERRSMLLPSAAKLCRADIVHAIADHADQVSLDVSLRNAISRADLAVVKALMVHGADPGDLHTDFEDLVFNNQVSMIQLLLEGPRLPCVSCRSSGLGIAVKNRAQDVVCLLLKNGADVNHDNATALLMAVEASRPDFVSTLISGPVAPSPTSLDWAAGRAYEAMNGRDSDDGRSIVEMCLAGGGAGPETNRILTKGVSDAVRRKQVNLLDTLLKFAKPTGPYEAEALIEAVRSEQQDVLAKLLALRPSSQSLTLAVVQALKGEDKELQHQTAGALVTAGAKGPCLAEALIEVVQRLVASTQYYDGAREREDEELFILFLKEGQADVDYKSGLALQLSVKASCKDLAVRIVARKPSPASLGASLPLAMAIRDGRMRQSLVEILLRHPVAEEAVNEALVDSIKGGPDSKDLTELLLARGDVNYNNGEAFIFAIRVNDLATLRELLKRETNYKTLFTATMEAVKLPADSRTDVLEELISHMHLDHLNLALKYIILESQPDLALAQQLLRAGAEPALENGVCIKNAACTLNVDATQVLADFAGYNEPMFTQAFAGVINSGRQWIAPEHLELVQVLLCHGASGNVVNRAMVEAVDYLAGNSAQKRTLEALVDMLVASGADVNFESGKIVGIAASAGDGPLLAHLLGQGATTETATIAFSTAIMAHHEEEKLMDLVSVFADKRTPSPDVNQPLPGMLPPLLLCMNHYRSVALLDCLWKQGCNLEATVPCKVYPDEPADEQMGKVNFDKEPVTALMWALLQGQEKIGADIIRAAVDRGANVNYTTEKTRSTPLLLAAKSGRFDIVQVLVAAGAKLSAKDFFHRSPLFYASRIGNVDSVSLLLKGKSGKNDGSLHEASRCFHPEVMRMLIDAGHEPDYRSATHGGRTALGEIALYGIAPDDVALGEDASDILKDAGANPLVQVHGKPIVFLALDNQDPVPITRLLLDKILWRSLNDDGCIYHKDNLHYSPSMYVAKGICKSPKSEAHELLELLKGHGATDHYYAGMEQQQPHDAVGLPAQIQAFEDARRARERRLQIEQQDHSLALQRDSEKVHHRVRMGDLENDMVVRHGDAITMQSLRRRGLEHTQGVQIATEKHQTDTNIAISAADTISQIQWQKHRDVQGMRAEERTADLNHTQVTREEDLNHISRKRAAKLDHTRQRHIQQLENRKEDWRAEVDIGQERTMLEIAYDQTKHNEQYRQRVLDHEQNFRHQGQIDHQNQWRVANQYQAQLEYNQAERLGYVQAHQQLQWVNQDNMLLRDQLASGRAAESHQMRMLEMEKERGNIAGRMNFQEWGAWKQSQGSGDAYGAIAAGPW